MIYRIALTMLMLTAGVAISQAEDRRVFHHQGREHKIPVTRKLNPIWWLKNEDRPYDEGWKEGKPEWYRKFTFNLRNPGHNFTHYVLGVADRDFTRRGPDAAHVWSQDPERRHNPCCITEGVLLPRPFLSRKGILLESYIGWRQDGNFGIALRKAQDVR